MYNVTDHCCFQYLHYNITPNWRTTTPKNSTKNFLLDVTDFDNYETFTKKVDDIVKDDGLNVLFNNAGVSPKSTRLNFVKTHQMFDTLTVNTVAPIMLTKVRVRLFFGLNLSGVFS